MKRASPLRHALALAIVATVATACGANASLPIAAGTGPSPSLPVPHHKLIPTVKVAKAVGWRADASPTAAPSLAVKAFARNLTHPRWLYILPNGDVLVSETNAPVRPDDGKGIKGWFFRHFQKKGGGAVPSPERIILLRDADGDGIAEVRHDFLTGLHSPFGIALAGDTLYVANTDAVVAFPYTTGDTAIRRAGRSVLALPAGTINHHWTKNILVTPDKSRMYVAVGSNSNAAENGIAKEEGRAAIWELQLATGEHRVFATGLRNPVGMTWEPKKGVLWTSVNERDEIGGDLVPDYMTSVRDGAFYGWPYSYYGSHIDERVKPQRPDLVAKAIAPDYALGSHTASLGLVYSAGGALPLPFGEGMFIGQHGSWNRNPPSGYKVVFVPFRDGQPAGAAVEVLTGFLDKEGQALGRPVGVAIDSKGALLVADDVGNAVWRVTGSASEKR
ncbi:MAG: sorbosone dehydrogenase family protein [Gemmatimonadaceae bacterium]